jgi:hypothetical protein
MAELANQVSQTVQLNLQHSPQGGTIVGTMRVESIEAHTVRVPLTMPTASSARSIKAREYVVRIVDECGAGGAACMYAGDSGGLRSHRGMRDIHPTPA